MKVYFIIENDIDIQDEDATQIYGSRVVSCFLDKKKASKEKLRLKKREKEIRQCRYCTINYELHCNILKENCDKKIECSKCWEYVKNTALFEGCSKCDTTQKVNKDNKIEYKCKNEIKNRGRFSKIYYLKELEVIE